MNLHEIIVVLSLIRLSWSEEFVIKTVSGSIKGIKNQYANSSIYEFRNIPYAKPPIGDLRFRKPQPYGNWNGIRDGTHFGASCMQDNSFATYDQNLTVSEDCLSLNVYVPNSLPTTSQQNKSVMIWIYGGGFVFGDARSYNPTALAMKGDVIVVTINYRLGLFGFLSTADDASPGNYGLWDQHFAFKWVNKNIASFGGNPYSVTIFGESAGGMSVALQSLVPQNKGLFQRVIAESGASNSLPALSNKGLYFAEKYAASLGCLNSTTNHLNTMDLVTCMRQKSSKELLSAQISDTLEQNHGLFRAGPDATPVIDGELIVDHPETILQKANSDAHKMFKSLDFMAGNCNMEGSLMLPWLFMKSNASHFDPSLGIPTPIVCDSIVPGLLEDLYPGKSLTKSVRNAVCKEYSSTDLAEQGRKAVYLVGDLMFLMPTIKTLEAHASDNDDAKTYLYIFNRPNLYLQNPFKWFNGSSHGSEIPYLFENNLVPPNDKNLSEAMLGYWTNFAKTGNPNDASLNMWPTYNISGMYYINLDTLITVKNHVINDRVFFWTKYIPSIVHNAIPIPIIIGK